MPFNIEPIKSFCLTTLDRTPDDTDYKYSKKELEALRVLITQLCEAYQHNTLDAVLTTLNNHQIVDDAPAPNNTQEDQLVWTILNYIYKSLPEYGRNSPLKVLTATLLHYLENMHSPGMYNRLFRPTMIRHTDNIPNQDRHVDGASANPCGPLTNRTNQMTSSSIR